MGFLNPKNPGFALVLRKNRCRNTTQRLLKLSSELNASAATFHFGYPVSDNFRLAASLDPAATKAAASGVHRLAPEDSCVILLLGANCSYNCVNSMKMQKQVDIGTKYSSANPLRSRQLR